MATLKELYEQGHRKFKHKYYTRIVETSHDLHFCTIDEIWDNDWEPVVEKKKKSAMLYRYTYISAAKDVYQTSWQSWKGENLDKIVKIETKTLEWEE